jgi:acyl carrier protein
MELFEELKKILVDELQVSEELVTPEAEFVNDMKLNSLEIADFIVLCEDKFEMEVDENDIHSILTVQDLCDYISERI